MSVENKHYTFYCCLCGNVHYDVSVAQTFENIDYGFCPTKRELTLLGLVNLPTEEANG